MRKHFPAILAAAVILAASSVVAASGRQPQQSAQVARQDRQPSLNRSAIEQRAAIRVARSMGYRPAPARGGR